MPIGSVWAAGSWVDGAWADNSWADAAEPTGPARRYVVPGRYQAARTVPGAYRAARTLPTADLSGGS